MSCLALAATFAQAQQTEVLLGVNSGFFTFSGASTEKSSGFVTYSQKPTEGYTNNPYSSNLGPAFGASGALQRVTRHNLILGVGLGYDILKSSTEINMLYGSGTAIAAKGKSSITYHFVNFYPHIGYRFSLDCLQFDLTGGFDLAKPLKAHESGTVSDLSGNKFTSSLDRPLEELDVRAHLQLNIFYRRTGLSLSYAEGFTNYKAGWVGGTNLVFSRLYRIGLVYKLN